MELTPKRMLPSVGQMLYSKGSSLFRLYLHIIHFGLRCSCLVIHRDGHIRCTETPQMVNTIGSLGELWKVGNQVHHTNGSGAACSAHAQYAAHA